MQRTVRLLIITTLLCALPSFIAAQKITRVKFRQGATVAIASGTLNGYNDRKIFVIRVRRGQVLRTEQIKAENSARYITVSIKSPSGEDVLDMDASCNNRKEVAPTEAGDYRIEVVECQKADGWRGNFKLKISVK